MTAVAVVEVAIVLATVSFALDAGIAAASARVVGFVVAAGGGCFVVDAAAESWSGQ